jgi:hypothetical protein
MLDRTNRIKRKTETPDARLPISDGVSELVSRARTTDMVCLCRVFLSHALCQLPLSVFISLVYTCSESSCPLLVPTSLSPLFSLLCPRHNTVVPFLLTARYSPNYHVTSRLSLRSSYKATATTTSLLVRHLHHSPPTINCSGVDSHKSHSSLHRALTPSVHCLLCLLDIYTYRYPLLRSHRYQFTSDLDQRVIDPSGARNSL